MKKIALFPGSFDPYTLGNHDIILKGLNIFDKIIIAIGHNSKKKRYFNETVILNKIKDRLISKKINENQAILKFLKR